MRYGVLWHSWIEWFAFDIFFRESWKPFHSDELSFNFLFFYFLDDCVDLFSFTILIQRKMNSEILQCLKWLLLLMYACSCKRNAFNYSSDAIDFDWFFCFFFIRTGHFPSGKFPLIHLFKELVNHPLIKMVKLHSIERWKTNRKVRWFQLDIVICVCMVAAYWTFNLIFDVFFCSCSLWNECGWSFWSQYNYKRLIRLVTHYLL